MISKPFDKASACHKEPLIKLWAAQPLSFSDKMIFKIFIFQDLGFDREVMRTEPLCTEVFVNNPD